MKIVIKRDVKGNTYTAGKMYVDGRHFADTLEPRAIDWSKEQKTPGKTAIPEGTFKLEMRYSTRFKTQMPFVLNVPHFDGIMLHVGNSVRDSRGCILVGTRTFPSVLTHSRKAVNRLILMMEEHKGESVTLTVENGF
ncbi:MAG: DUF5675 family protein [Prevotella sp.]